RRPTSGLSRSRTSTTRPTCSRSTRTCCRLLDGEHQELRELTGGEVVVADQHEGLATVSQPRAERQSLDVVQGDPERVEVEQQLLVRRPAPELDREELDRVARARRADGERTLHDEQE